VGKGANFQLPSSLIVGGVAAGVIVTADAGDAGDAGDAVAVLAAVAIVVAAAIVCVGATAAAVAAVAAAAVFVGTITFFAIGGGDGCVAFFF